jgi:choline dehydrogenase-like flavoprotein
MTVAQGAWGWGLRRTMMDYHHWAAFGLLGEILPWADNRIELAEETDQHGMRVAKVTFGLKDNDRKLVAFAEKKTMEVMSAAGAEEVVQEKRFAHLIGGARMGSDPNTSVVDKFGRTHDIPNLFCCDGSILPTQGSANPGLTIQALAARTAQHIIEHRDDVLAARRPPMDEPAVETDLSPPGTFTRGIPQLVR